MLIIYCFQSFKRYFGCDSSCQGSNGDWSWSIGPSGREKGRLSHPFCRAALPPWFYHNTEKEMNGSRVSQMSASVSHQNLLSGPLLLQKTYIAFKSISDSKITKKKSPQCNDMTWHNWQLMKALNWIVYIRQYWKGDVDAMAAGWHPITILGVVVQVLV